MLAQDAYGLLFWSQASRFRRCSPRRGSRLRKSFTSLLLGEDGLREDGHIVRGFLVGFQLSQDSIQLSLPVVLLARVEHVRVVTIVRRRRLVLRTEGHTWTLRRRRARPERRNRRRSQVKRLGLPHGLERSSTLRRRLRWRPGRRRRHSLLRARRTSQCRCSLGLCSRLVLLHRDLGQGQLCPLRSQCSGLLRHRDWRHGPLCSGQRSQGAADVRGARRGRHTAIRSCTG